MDIVNPILVKNKKEQTKTVALSMGAGDQTITPDAGMVLSSVTVGKPATLISSNIKNGVNIGGVVGDFSVPLEAQKTVALDMASGDQTITPTSGYDGMGEVVVEKPSTLLAENIKDGVTIGGVTGNYTAPTPTLVTKTITENGTYSAAGDNADGYSSVTVNVQQETVVEKDVTFYDYDGTLVASYTAADFANISAMPANPSHTGLTAQGWNWEIAAAKTYVASYGKLNIGQMYATASGKTEYDIEVNEATGMTATLSGTSGTEKDWGDGTTDTMETHTYATAGNYTIKLSGTTLPSISSSKKVSAVRIANGVTSLPNNCFYNCRALKTIALPDTIVSYGISAMNGCRSLIYMTIPIKTSELTRTINISNYCFNGSTSLQTVSLPKSIDYIGNYAFNNTFALQNIFVGYVLYLGSNSFSGTSSLKSIVIPNSITSIGAKAFYDCSWLTIITILATTPPTLSATDAIPSSVTKIYIPNGTLSAYQTASNWSSFSSLFVELPA